MRRGVSGPSVPRGGGTEGRHSGHCDRSSRRGNVLHDATTTVQRHAFLPFLRARPWTTTGVLHGSRLSCNRYIYIYIYIYLIDTCPDSTRKEGVSLLDRSCS